MNAIVTSAAPRPPQALLVCYLLEAKYEFLRVLRTPAFAVPTLLFPPMFYALFGLLLSHANPDSARYLFATYCVFGVMAPGLFGFGVGLAMERERGWLALKRVAPMPPGAYLLAKMAMAMMFAAIMFVVLAALAYAGGGVRLAAAQWLALAAVSIGGVLPFCALGLVVGSHANASGAPVIVNFIYIPMAFLSGLWVPLNMLPGFIAQIAPLWPSTHLAALALDVIGLGAPGSILGHLGAVALFTLAAFLVARRRLARTSA